MCPSSYAKALRADVEVEVKRSIERAISKLLSW